jgi:peroxiredoxin
MLRTLLAAVTPLLFATVAWAADPSPMNSARRDDPRRMVPVATDPQAATIQVGGPAPMFSFIAADGRWHRSDELVLRGAVLMLIAPADDDLVAIEKLRAAFVEMGITPVAILNLPTRGTAALSRKLSVETTLVSDPMCAIGGLYHSLDPSTMRDAPSYFVIDRSRTLRAMYYGPFPPAEMLLATSARSLGRPLPESVFSSSSDQK